MRSVGGDFLAKDRDTRHPGTLVRKPLGVGPGPGEASSATRRPSWSPSLSLDKGCPRLMVPGVAREPAQGCKGFLCTGRWGQGQTTEASLPREAEEDKRGSKHRGKERGNITSTYMIIVRIQ